MLLEETLFCFQNIPFDFKWRKSECKKRMFVCVFLLFCKSLVGSTSQIHFLRTGCSKSGKAPCPVPFCCGWPSESRCGNSHKRSNGAFWDTSAWKRNDLRGKVTETYKIWRCMKQMVRNCLFLPLLVQDLEANKSGQISNKWWELVLDLPARRSRELLIRGCCGCKVYSCVQRKTIVLESKIVRDHWIDKPSKAKQISTAENNWRLSK